MTDEKGGKDPSYERIFKKMDEWDEEYGHLHDEEVSEIFHAREINSELEGGWFSYVQKKLCEVVDLDELPHASHTQHEAFSRPGEEGYAIRSWAEADFALGVLLDRFRHDFQTYELIVQVANGASEASFWLPILAKARGAAVAATQAAEAKSLRTRNAIAARTNWARRDRALAVWEEHPDWTTHAVAKAVAEPGEDIASISRSIGPLAPPTSPSFKGSGT